MKSLFEYKAFWGGSLFLMGYSAMYHDDVLWRPVFLLAAIGISVRLCNWNSDRRLADDSIKIINETSNEIVLEFNQHDTIWFFINNEPKSTKVLGVAIFIGHFQIHGKPDKIKNNKGETYVHYVTEHGWILQHKAFKSKEELIKSFE